MYIYIFLNHLVDSYIYNIDRLLYCLALICFARTCPTLCDPMDSSLSGSCVHEIFQARILEWVAISSSRGSSPTRD